MQLFHDEPTTPAPYYFVIVQLRGEPDTTYFIDSRPLNSPTVDTIEASVRSELSGMSDATSATIWIQEIDPDTSRPLRKIILSA